MLLKHRGFQSVACAIEALTRTGTDCLM